MRDIPMFTTEYGVASLILREIPYRKEAYIRIHDAAKPDEFLKECVTFCCMAGAKKVFATGHKYLLSYALHTAVWKMCRSMNGLPETTAMTIPVTEGKLEEWRQIYNDAMADVANASYMDRLDAERMLQSGEGYFVHSNGELLGIGKVSGDTIQAIVSLVRGAGQDVLLALTHALFSEQVYLEVASSNVRAVRLYERLGFVKTAELTEWYCVY